LDFLEDVTSPSGQHTINTAHGLFWNLNLDQVDRLKNTGLCKQGGGIEHTASSWDYLTTTAVDGVCVQGNIKDIEAD
jgi:hypothetical protein